MTRHHQQVMTVIASAAALVLLASGELRPAGVRTAFELLAGAPKCRPVACSVAGGL
ncbi:MAG: hypothetical protein ACT4N2_06665 [Hyphomicrobium sp.]